MTASGVKETSDSPRRQAVTPGCAETRHDPGRARAPSRKGSARASDGEEESSQKSRNA